VCQTPVRSVQCPVSRADRVGEHEAELPRGHLLVQGHEGGEFRSGVGQRRGRRQAYPLDDRGDSLGGPAVESAGGDAHFRRGDHADRHRLAMPPRIVAPGHRRLDRMADRVPEVQQGPLAGDLALVAGDDGGLDPDVSLEQLGQAVDAPFAEVVGSLFVPIEESGVANDGVLDGLSQAGAEVAFAERGQDGRVDQDEARLVKRADQVLAARVVDRGLAADAGVHVGLDGGGALGKRDAAHPCGSHEAGEVADHAAAEGDGRARPVDPGGGQRVVDSGGVIEGLGPFAGADGVERRFKPGFAQGLFRLLAVERTDVAVGDHEHPPGLDPFSQNPPDVREPAGSNEHRVGR